MSDSEDYCDFCDLPQSQCVHGRPAPKPEPVAVKPPRQPKPRASTRRAATPEKQPVSRWTQPEVFKPLILSVLESAGGRLDAEDVFAQVQGLAADRLSPADSETTPEGEPRWRLAVRRARLALIEDGLLVKAGPGVWQLADPA